MRVKKGFVLTTAPFFPFSVVAKSSLSLSLSPECHIIFSCGRASAPPTLRVSLGHAAWPHRLAINYPLRMHRGPSKNLTRCDGAADDLSSDGSALHRPPHQQHFSRGLLVIVKRKKKQPKNRRHAVAAPIDEALGAASRAGSTHAGHPSSGLVPVEMCHRSREHQFL